MNVRSIASISGVELQQKNSLITERRSIIYGK